MALSLTTQGQDVIECDICRNGVSFFCRRCNVKLCDICLPVHARVKSKFGHDIVDYASKDEDENDDEFLCDSHPENKCAAYCKKCDVPICILCVSIKHKTHEMSELQEKIEELLKDITWENDRLQSSRDDLERLLDYTNNMLFSSSLNYQKTKDDVTARGEDWHKQIDKTVEKLHLQLDELKKETEAVLHKRKKEFEEMIRTVEDMNRKTTKFKKSKNVTEMQKFRQVIQQQKTMSEFTQYSFPTFLECSIDEKYLETYFGYIEKNKERKISLLKKNFSPNTDLAQPSVSTVINSGFPTDRNGNCLYAIAVTDDKKVWMGGESTELKLFDLKGHLHRTVTITCLGMYICMYNKQVVFVDQTRGVIQKISDDDTVVAMFTTGDWKPYGITGSASGNLLICLQKGDQSKVVRCNTTGTVLQEIQYDSQSKPLYVGAYYIAENVNGDIIVTDFKRKNVIAVDRLGKFRFSYSGVESATSVATDSVGHVIFTDYQGNKIHMLDRDGQFLRYIMPEGGIKDPRAVCIIADGDIIVGECLTGLAKQINFF